MGLDVPVGRCINDYYLRDWTSGGDVMAVPIALIAPIIGGAALWVYSPKLLFSVALFPAIVSILLAFFIVSSGSPSRTSA